MKTRRKFLFGTLGALGLGAVVAWMNKNSVLRWLILNNKNRDLSISEAPALADNICVLTSKQTEGPFFIDSAMRQDIREDRQGKTMHLNLQILRYPECTPIPNAKVEIWHCDAEGKYSGYPEELAHNIYGTLKLTGMKDGNIKPMTEARYLRGAQSSDENGNLKFITVFPGWYDPRTPHIHIKILIDDKEQLTSQFYFETEFQDKIFMSTAPYSTYGKSPYNLSNDVVLKGEKKIEGLLLKPVWSEEGPLEVSVKIGINPA